MVVLRKDISYFFIMDTQLCYCFESKPKLNHKERRKKERKKKQKDVQNRNIFFFFFKK